MNEKQRQSLVKEVGKKQELLGQIKDRTNKVNRLLLNDSVKEYIRLSRQIVFLKKEADLIEDVKEKRVLQVFSKSLQSKENMDICSHDIFVYVDSKKTDPYKDEDEHSTGYASCEDENDSEFMFNTYMCLECGLLIHTEKYEEFEGTHKVLKMKSLKSPRYEISFPYISAFEYQKIYYQLLLEYPVEEAQKILIDLFEFDLNYRNKNGEELARKRG